MNKSGESNPLNQFRHKIAFIVPTRNRPQLLARLLDSIKIQTIQPDQIIIVDGSDQSIENEIKTYLNTTVNYVRVFPPGLTRQRNEGRKALRDDITLVGYLDDDIVMEKDATEAMLDFWETCPQDMGGASFNIINSSFYKATWLSKLFCLDNGRKGSVLKSGNNTGVAPLSENIYSQWLCGGATIWREKIFSEFIYDEWYKGWAYLEDVDFSFTVSKKYKLAAIHSAKVQHLPPPLKPQKYSSFIKRHVVEQYYFVNKHKELSVFLFFWSILGSILIITLVGLRRLRPVNFSIAWAYLSGLFNVLTGNLRMIDESYRE